MLYELIAVVAGGVIGFAATWKFVQSSIREEKERIEEIRKAKVATISGVESIAPPAPEKPPADLREFVDYISERYMLKEVTLLTPEGLPITSNSRSAEEDAAIAPEILKVAKRLMGSDRIFVSSGDERVLVMQVNPDVILHAKIARDISKKEVDSLKEEVNSIMEGLI